MYGTFKDESVCVKVLVSCIFISILQPYLFIFLPGYMYVSPMECSFPITLGNIHICCIWNDDYSITFVLKQPFELNNASFNFLNEICALSLVNTLFRVMSCKLSFILTVKSYARHLNILTNRTTALNVYSVLKKIYADWSVELYESRYILCEYIDKVLTYKTNMQQTSNFI